MNINKTLPLPFNELLPTLKTLTFSPPPYPSSFRYIDDFTEKSHVLTNVEENKWRISCNGTTESLDFERYINDGNLIGVIKGMVLDNLSKYSTSTSVRHTFGLAHFPLSSIIEFLEIRPDTARPFWDSLRAQSFPISAYRGLKALLRFASERRLGLWTPLYLPFISASLPLPTVDKFSAVRTGDVFLSIEEEALLVRWIYERAINAKTLADKDLKDAALLICNYQFAMRPKQIGVLRRRDCRVLDSVAGNGSTVHLTFRMLKQKSTSTALIPLIRKVKRDWASIFTEVYSRGKNESGDAHLFGHNSSNSVTNRIIELLATILESDRSATDLRHSGAMRQVDAGASAEDLAEFMGHSSLESGLVYFDQSATQSERVNQALGISETYQRVARLGKERFISNDDLAKLKGDQQIAGVPHGIPISGIGGCQTGQPSCPYNPVTACYGCPKFMPLNDIGIHKKVLHDYQGVVKFFYEASRGESESPAYLQLKRTISEVNSVIDELESIHA